MLTIWTMPQCSAVKAGATKYTAVAGDLALRTAIAADLTHRKGLASTAEQIVVWLLFVLCVTLRDDRLARCRTARSRRYCRRCSPR